MYWSLPAARAFLVEHAVRILEAVHLVMLHEVDSIGSEPAQRFVELPRGLTLRTAIDLGHEEHARSITVA